MTVRTRFAPSPTGYLHVGGARTALFSYLFARKHGGVFVLRIEDTDLERSTAASVNAILEGMAWLGLTYDEGPFFQTNRFERYNAVIDELIAKGLAYRCDCPKERIDALREGQMARKEKPRYDGRCRGRHIDPQQPHAVRFRNPDDGLVVVDDMIRGRIAFRNDELDDLIVRRTDGSPTYNLSVVVDDIDMGITHVIRGDDHINNTPRQINILRALGQEPPRYAHVPMILGDDGSRLSKRHGAVSVIGYRDDGFLPEALLNYLVRLGWSHGDREIFSLDEMIELFDIAGVNKAASTFNTDKLLWLNQHYIQHADPQRIAHLLSPHMGRLGIDPSEGGGPHGGGGGAAGARQDPGRAGPDQRLRLPRLRQLRRGIRQEAPAPGGRTGPGARTRGPGTFGPRGLGGRDPGMDPGTGCPRPGGEDGQGGPAAAGRGGGARRIARDRGDPGAGG